MLTADEKTAARPQVFGGQRQGGTAPVPIAARGAASAR